MSFKHLAALALSFLLSPLAFCLTPGEARLTSGESLPAAKPLFADPNYHGSCDPEVIWNEHTREWWVFYTARRATLERGTYVGTPLGVIASKDLREWRFLGYASMDGVAGRPDMPVTYWAPGIIRDGDTYHMFVTYKNNAEPPWGGDGEIRHYIAPASDLLNGWKLSTPPCFPQPDPIDATLIKVGSDFRAYFRVNKDGGIQWSSSKDLLNWTHQGKCAGDMNASPKMRGFDYQEGPFIFSFAGSYWMVTDPHKGLAIYQSADAIMWKLQGRILEEPGTGKFDATLARHPSVAVVGDRAFLIYHVEPNRPYPTPPPEKRTIEQKKSFLQIAELKVIDGVLTCDRNAPVFPPASSAPSTTSVASPSPIASNLLPAATPHPRPNFFIFLCDDLSVRDLTCYGATDVRTPNFQKLADTGLSFDRAFIASPACAPSRTALLTGLMPARNGAEANHAYKRDGIASLPPALKALGYEVVAFGKVAHGKTDCHNHGFDLAAPAYKLDAVEAWLAKRDASRPYCVFVGTNDPHVPWDANQGYDPAKLKLTPYLLDTPETREHRARYYTEVTRADTDFGRMQKLFGGTNTVSIFTSDHGAQWAFGKWNLYDEGTRVPLLISWPGHTVPGSRTAAMVSWIDLLPTLIEVAGGNPPVDIDGRSFATVLTHPATPARDRIFTTHNNDGRANVYPIRAIRTERWKYIRNLHPEWQHTNHSDRFRIPAAGAYWESWDKLAETDKAAAALIARYKIRSAEELFDIIADPYELNNLAADPAHATTLRSLSAELDAWMKTQGDTAKVSVKGWLPGDPAIINKGGKSED